MDLNKTSLVAPSMFEAGLGLPPRSRGVSPSRLPLPRAQTPEISSVRFSGLPGSKTRPPSSLRGPVSVAGRVGRCPPSTRAEGGTAGGHSEVLVVLRAAPRGGREVRPEASTRLPGPGAEGGWSRCSGGVGGGRATSRAVRRLSLLVIQAQWFWKTMFICRGVTVLYIICSTS